MVCCGVKLCYICPINCCEEFQSREGGGLERHSTRISQQSLNLGHLLLPREGQRELGGAWFSADLTEQGGLVVSVVHSIESAV